MISNERRVGMVAAAGIVVLLGAVFLIGRFNLSLSGYELKVRYQFVNDLKVNAAVKYAGGPVIGHVRKLYVDNETVMAVLWIDRSVKIRKDCEFWIFTAGMLGEQYVEIHASPSGTAPVLKRGEEVRGIDPVSLDATFIKLGKIIDALTPMFGREEVAASIHSVVADLKKASGTISAVVAKHGDGVDKALVDIELFGRNIGKMSNDFEQLGANLREMSDPKSPESLHQAVKTVNAAMASLENTAKTVESLARKLDSGQGLLGAMINDKKLADDFKAVVKKMKDQPIQAKVKLF
jgi:phospholipid/cholesterol/gamma-HCH transport system substrate-binding protein